MAASPNLSHSRRAAQRKPSRPPASPKAPEPAGDGPRLVTREADADVGAVPPDEHRVEIKLGKLGDALGHGADPVQQLDEGRHVQSPELPVPEEHVHHHRLGPEGGCNNEVTMDMCLTPGSLLR